MCIRDSLCTIRPILESGKWGYKQRRVYRLDGDGNRILDEKGKPLFDAVPTTDWGLSLIHIYPHRPVDRRCPLQSPASDRVCRQA